MKYYYYKMIMDIRESFLEAGEAMDSLGLFSCPENATWKFLLSTREATVS